ncbi:hypothetical protein B566_EDAN017705 [Ephemera danica]|nr:hypothetical protein B566_EDAN017705 [Ephemera danica]
MVREANVAKAQAERNLNESQMKVEVLQAEVAALKTLVLTSTPSRPNTHLHPQLEPAASTSGMNLFTRSHRRSPSHFNLKYGRENSPPDSPVKDKAAAAAAALLQTEQREQSALSDLEVDPMVHKELLAWRQTVSLSRSEPFVERMYMEDIDLCLDFFNKELGKRVQQAVEAGTLFIESVTEKSRIAFPKKCGLMEVQRLCQYRMRLGDQEQW